MRFKLQGERKVPLIKGTNKEDVRNVKFICEAEVQGILVRQIGQAIHLRGMGGGRCRACGSKETFPWMDTETQSASWEIHPDRCNFAYRVQHATD